MKRFPGRPATGVTPNRNVRIGALWLESEVLAAGLGVTMTDYVKEALREKNQRESRRIAEQASR